MHVGLLGNQRADRLAKESSQLLVSTNPAIYKISRCGGDCVTMNPDIKLSGRGPQRLKDYLHRQTWYEKPLLGGEDQHCGHRKDNTSYRLPSNKVKAPGAVPGRDVTLYQTL